MGRVEAICVSIKKGEKKSPRPSARLVGNHGIEGDAHAGPWHRQVSLLAAEDIETMRRRALPDLKSGDFAENLVVSGVDIGALGLGSRLQVGVEVDLTVTQLGKACHHRCAIFYQTGDCIMPRLGLFARVLRGGTVSVGDTAVVLQTVPRKKLQAVILSLSDSCARGEANDTAGPAVERFLESCLQAHVYASERIPEDRDKIAARLRHYSNWHSVDIVLVVGGTGFSPSDMLPEAETAVMEWPTAHLDDSLQCLSREMTPMALFPRGTSAIRNGTLIVGLPGLERGSVQDVRTVLPSFAQVVAKLRGNPSDFTSTSGELPA